MLLTLRFDGSAFHGWQIQENASTVQQALEKACNQILGESVKTVSCSRTDTGVHANMFCTCLKTENNIPCEKLKCALNAFLPKTVAVYGCEEVSENFHARYDCMGKEYIYKIWNGKERNPFYENYALHYPHPLDEKLLNEAAAHFVGRFDFSAFCSAGATVKTKVRTVYSCNVKREGELVIFSVCGDGFLYNMVRIMVGTLLSVAQGKIKSDEITEIILSKDRNKAGVTAKPAGLYLNKVFYKQVNADE